MKILKEDIMTSNISDKTEKKFQEVKSVIGEQNDNAKLEAEGACENIVGKDEKKVCEVKS
jgi:uncharacterized protein YjbJ (UPF0337 family)